MTDNAPMIEHVAEAIARILVLKTGVVLDAEIWDAAARAAIEAMRDPTYPMLVALQRAGGYIYDPLGGWHAAIDAALKERKA